MLSSILLSTALVAVTGNNVAAIEIGPVTCHAQAGKLECVSSCGKAIQSRLMVVCRDETQKKVNFAPVLGVVGPLPNRLFVAVGRKEVILGPTVLGQATQTQGGMVGQQPTNEKV